MAKAYLKVLTKPGKERAVKDALLKIKGVSAADLTSGEQDIIATISGKNYEEILNLVVKKVRGIKEIERTVTNLILE